MPFTQQTSGTIDLESEVRALFDQLTDDATNITATGSLTVTGASILQGSLTVNGTVSMPNFSVTAANVAETTNKKWLTVNDQTIAGIKTFSSTPVFSSGLTSTALTVAGTTPYFYSAGVNSAVAVTIGAGGIPKDIQAYLHNSSNPHTVTLPNMDTLGIGHSIWLYSSSLPGLLSVKTFNTTDPFYDANNRLFITGQTFTIPENTACHAFFSRTVNGWVISIPCPFQSPSFANPTLTGTTTLTTLKIGTTTVTATASDINKTTVATNGVVEANKMVTVDTAGAITSGLTSLKVGTGNYQPVIDSTGISIGATATFGKLTGWNSDLTGLNTIFTGGTTTGTLLQGHAGGHLIAQIRGNDVSDSFSVVCNSNLINATSAADRLVFRANVNGDTRMGLNGELAWNQVDKALTVAADSTLKATTAEVGILRVNNTGFNLYRDGTGNDYGSWGYWNYATPQFGTGIDAHHGGASHFGSIIAGARSGHFALQLPANGVDDSFFICTNSNAANGITDYTPDRKLLLIKNTGDLNFGTAGEVAWVQSTKTLTLASTSTLALSAGKLKIGGVTVNTTAAELNMLSGLTSVGSTYNSPVIRKVIYYSQPAGNLLTVTDTSVFCVFMDNTSSTSMVTVRMPPYVDNMERIIVVKRSKASTGVVRVKGATDTEYFNEVINGYIDLAVAGQSVMLYCVTTWTTLNGY